MVAVQPASGASGRAVGPGRGRAVPEEGQQVRVRDRDWVVAGVHPSSQPVDVRSSTAAAPEHLLTLASVEDDAYGEELRVVWELEPGARIRPRLELPTPDPGRFDDPGRLDAFLDAVRWGAVTNASAGVLQAPFRSGIQIEDYQLDPVVRALSMPRANLLIADDVGLGKTIEAGLVVQELLLRHRARTVLVVCPASLCVHWRDQMAEKFGLEFRIMDAALLARLRRERGPFTNPWTHFPRLIVSIDWLKRDRPRRLLREVWQGRPRYPRTFDLLIVDEVHNAAPAGRPGGYATDSLRTAAIREIAPHFEHRLFLSATPHNGFAESFTALLELLDDQRFARGVRPDPEQLQQVMIRRLKTDITGWDGKPVFHERDIGAIRVDYPADERAAHADLNAYAHSRQTRGQASLPGTVERRAADFVLTLLKKRLFSSPEAFKRTLAVHRATVTSGRRRSAARPTMRLLRRTIDTAGQDFGDEDAQQAATEDALATATAAGLAQPLTGDETRLLDRMEAWATDAAGRGDAKLGELIRFLEGAVLATGAAGASSWAGDRVIVFTEYRDTQRWLHEQILSHFSGSRFGGLDAANRVALLHGAMDTDDREAVKHRFLAAPDVDPVRILIATDAASEGIDLQRHCHRLVHYEIPWNPNRMEQRNGRIDRHGQPHQPVIRHFAGRAGADVGTLDWEQDFLARVIGKVNQIRLDLGSVGPVIADQVEEAMLGRRTRLDTAAAESRAPRRLLRIERSFREEVAKLHQRLMASRDELHLTPGHVRRVVEVGLELAGQQPLRPAELHRPAGDPRPSGPVFHLPPLTGSWSRCLDGLMHPLTRTVRPVTFDDQVAAGHDDVVLVHLGHRLAQQCLRLLRAQIWSAQSWSGGLGGGRLARVTARVVPDGALDVPAVVAHGRLVITGTTGDRLHEEVIAAGGRLPGGQFERLNVTALDKLLAAVTDQMPAPAMLRTLATDWDRWERPLRSAFSRRTRERTGGLENDIARRCEQEVRSITEVLTELRRAIDAELSAPDNEQLTLNLNLEESDQLRRDAEALRRRVARIPDDIAAETEVIRARYDQPTPRAFPAAVTFLVPQRLAF